MKTEIWEIIRTKSVAGLTFPQAVMTVGLKEEAEAIAEQYSSLNKDLNISFKVVLRNH